MHDIESDGTAWIVDRSKSKEVDIAIIVAHKRRFLMYSWGS